MDFATEMNKIISLELEEFKLFINRKVKANKNYLEQLFWLSNGIQMTVLNYLIEAHQETQNDSNDIDPSKDLTAKIDYVVKLSRDVNVGEPLHQAILSEKNKLALHLLGTEKNNYPVEDSAKFNVNYLLDLLRKKSNEIVEGITASLFDLNRRDSEGRTLISLILDTKNLEILFNLLMNKPNVHAATSMTNAKVPFQPIHQAVALDHADGIRLLAQQEANLSNPLGLMKDTPVLLAARLGKINALEALLELPVDNLKLEVENNHLFEDKTTGHTAMDELCKRILDNTEKSEAIRGVAMLLCRGAEPPRSDALRNLLSTNRVDLLKAVHEYLEDKPQLVDSFVNQCHLTESALHYIVYADHSWGSSIRHLFGKPSDVAFMVEGLVVRKYSNPINPQGKGDPLPTTATVNLSAEKEPLKLYAEFVRRYNQAYDSQLLSNPWSTMRWMIAEGRCDWATVLRYSSTNPTSRTRIIIHEMFNPIPGVHDDVGSNAQESIQLSG